jgi:pimeloyl-ACP methyl ester carboxylesterase
VARGAGHTDSVSWNLWPFRRKPLLHVASDSGRGAPVVLLHGIASSSVTFEYVIPQLTDRRRVVALDLLGFGRSTAPASTQFTIDEHVDAVARTLEHQNVATPFTLVGHSLGALISLRLAARFPKMVGHLVLVAPPVYLPSDTIADPVERVRMDAYLRLYDFMRKNRDFTTSAAQAMERISPIRNLVDVNESNWRAFSLSLEKCIESQTTVADIAQVRCAIDVIYGNLDPFLAPAGLRVIERMRGVATTRVEGVDHVIRPKLAKALVKVIDNPSPPTAPIKLVGRAR